MIARMSYCMYCIMNESMNEYFIDPTRCSSVYSMIRPKGKGCLREQPWCSASMFIFFLCLMCFVCFIFNWCFYFKFYNSQWGQMISLSRFMPSTSTKDGYRFVFKSTAVYSQTGTVVWIQQTVWDSECTKVISLTFNSMFFYGLIMYQSFVFCFVFYHQIM